MKALGLIPGEVWLFLLCLGARIRVHLSERLGSWMMREVGYLCMRMRKGP